jgi:hypothetical protein
MQKILSPSHLTHFPVYTNSRSIYANGNPYNLQVIFLEYRRVKGSLGGSRTISQSVSILLSIKKNSTRLLCARWLWSMFRLIDLHRCRYLAFWWIVYHLFWRCLCWPWGLPSETPGNKPKRSIDRRAYFKTLILIVDIGWYCNTYSIDLPSVVFPKRRQTWCQRFSIFSHREMACQFSLQYIPFSLTDTNESSRKVHFFFYP